MTQMVSGRIGRLRATMTGPVISPGDPDFDHAPLPASLEYFLNTSQWLDASGGEPSRAFPKLVEAVRRVLSGAIPGPTMPPHESPRGATQRSLVRPQAVVLGLIAVAICGLAIDMLWMSKHIAEDKTVAAAVPATVRGPALKRLERSPAAPGRDHEIQCHFR